MPFDLVLAEDDVPLGTGDVGIDEVAFVDAGAGEGVLIALRKRRDDGGKGVKLKKETVDRIVSGLAKSKTLTIAKFEGIKASIAKERPLEEILSELDPEDMKTVLMAIQQASMTPDTSAPAAPVEAADKPVPPPPAPGGPAAADAKPEDKPAMPTKADDTAKATEKRDAEARIEKAEARAAEAMAKAEALEEERNFEKALRRAEGDEFKFLPLSATQIAKRLMRIAKGTADEQKEELTFLKSVNEALRQSSIFQSFGTTVEGRDEDSLSPGERLMAKAKARAKELEKSEKLRPSVALSKAMTEVAKEHPELYEEQNDQHLDSARKRR